MINHLMKILSGEVTLDDHSRYEFARVGVGIVHIALLIMFWIVGCIPLVIFNCFSVLFYTVFLEVLIRQEKYSLVFIGCYLEIVLHSSFACIILGTTFSFSLYNIGLLYVAYYFSYISQTSHRKILIPTILGVINVCLTIGIHFYNYITGPVFTDYSSFFCFAVSVMNFSIAAFMIMTFATLHSIEIRRKEYELHTINSELDILAHYDALTKLRNRHSMEKELYSILKHTPDDYCFIMGDIDDFKQFNDTYGHACGDYVLKSVADIILRNTNDQHIACRWGGEEVLILMKSNLEYARIIAEKIRYEIEYMNGIFNDTIIHVTMTFGVAPCLSHDSFEKYISLADRCLYDGKNQGKNCVVCHNHDASK